MIKYFRRIIRALFCSEPIFLDGEYIRSRMSQGLSWDDALRERSDQNVKIILRWYRGE